MNGKYLLRPRAIADLLHHHAYLRVKDPSSADKFNEETKASFNQLVVLPHLGYRRFSSDPEFNQVRVLPVSRRFSNYLIIYEPKPGTRIFKISECVNKFATMRSRSPSPSKSSKQGEGRPKTSIGFWSARMA